MIETMFVAKGIDPAGLFLLLPLSCGKSVRIEVENIEWTFRGYEWHSDVFGCKTRVMLYRPAANEKD